MAVFGGFWDEIPYLGVNFPTLNPLLGQKTAAERGALVAILRVKVDIWGWMMAGISEGDR